MCHWGAADNSTGREGKKIGQAILFLRSVSACSLDHHHLFLLTGSENGEVLRRAATFILEAKISSTRPI